MGNSFRGKKLGTFGDFGTFSTFYSHHMTTIEGGFVVCRDESDHWRCVGMREHGWIRRLPAHIQKKKVAAHPDLDSRFLFTDVGYNFRPTDVSAVIGQVQLRHLDTWNDIRIRNYEAIQSRLRHSLRLDFPKIQENANVAFLGLVLLYRGPASRAQFQDALDDLGVETRPIISGNFLRQPCLDRWGVRSQEPIELTGAEYVHAHGVYIGLHAVLWSEKECDELALSIQAALDICERL